MVDQKCAHPHTRSGFAMFARCAGYIYCMDCGDLNADPNLSEGERQVLISIAKGLAFPEPNREWEAEGLRLREDRMSRDMSLREEAKAKGILAYKLSQMELGAMKPYMLER